MQHAGQAGNAVVHGDEQLGAFGLRERQVHDGGREAVAVDGAVGTTIGEPLGGPRAA